ncbi:pyrroloquinoline quinone-dependent dehydrogenase [Granulicella sp. dw_53]|uniref:pyrroloquinoline quinone-dependent dehydrogenase n=1 Tax=Granulicella sp. dw_53 TaxID=2719792 RepID=UPI0021040939|nr:pyrroloquinoline quinone-dependent dehydrogenase [Granulicella sp. dw_53]
MNFLEVTKHTTYKSVLLFCACLIPQSGSAADKPAAGEWPFYGGDQGGSKYSALADINLENVGKLKLAWEWQAGERPISQYNVTPGVFETTPVMRDGKLYLSTSYGQVVSLDAASGEELWKYDPRSYEGGQPALGVGFVHRGIALWEEPVTKELRIFMSSRSRLIQLDALTGQPIKTFGENGSINLLEGLRWSVNPNHFDSSSPPVVYKNIVIVGNAVGDRLMFRRDPPGDVRAYDATTGKQIWCFHTIPWHGEFGSKTWKDGANEFTGHANVWAPMTLDVERGLIYLPVSTPSNDFFGGRRLGSGLFADSLVCLDARTGKRRWHFQLVHHGLWDYDAPSPPNLVTITVNGRRIDAVVQLTKQGFAFVFDRVTGRPVWPIRERPVPPSDVPGEEAWLTQPMPTKPQAFSEQGVNLKDAFDLSPYLKAEAVAQLEKYRLGNLYTPPSFRGTMMLPGIIGGANWGGGAFDPETGRLYIKTTNMAAVALLHPPDRSSTNPRAAETDGDYVREGRTNATFHDGIPLLKPPYGYLTALDLNRGEIVWHLPFGDDLTLRNHPALKGINLPSKLGASGTAGAIVTKGGLIFVGGGDTVFHAINKSTGEDIWTHSVGRRIGGTPMTYISQKRQYVVVAVGAGEHASLMAFSR